MRPSDLPDGACGPGQAFWRLFPIECCHVREFFKWLGNSTKELSALEVLNALSRCLDLSKGGCIWWEYSGIIRTHTLIARVRIAAITSSELPRTQLSSQVGSYSQMVVAFSTAAIFVIWPIMSTFPRLMTCPKQLQLKWRVQQVKIKHYWDLR